LGQIKKLFGQTAIYGVSSIFGRAVNFLLVPLYTAVFEPSEYGVVTELYAYVAFLMVFYLYGIETTYFRFATKYENHQSYFRIAVTQSLGIALLLSGVIIGLSGDIANMLGYPESREYIVWLALILGMDGLVAVPFARLRLLGKARQFARYKISNILLNVGLNLFFLVFCPYWLELYPHHFLNRVYDSDVGVGYVFLSNALASTATLLFFLPGWLQFRPLFNLPKWKEMWYYATPLAIMGLAGVINEMLSRALLRHYLPEGFYSGMSNLAVLGIFGACYKLSMLMNLSVQAFRYAYEPFYFSKSKDKNSPVLFARVMNAFIIYGCLAFMAISIVLPEIAPLVLRQKSYLEALHVVPVLLFAGVFLGIFFNLSVWYKVTDRTRYGAWITLLGSGITILLNLLLIPVLGYEGSALATLGAYLLMAIVSYLWGRKYYPIPYQWGKAILYLFYAAFLVACLYIGDFMPILRYILGCSGFVFFIIVVFYIEKRKVKA
jgi:O-antigen/teichoic acid export membrane protein